jgi:hypothetical protein
MRWHQQSGFGANLERGVMPPGAADTFSHRNSHREVRVRFSLQVMATPAPALLMNIPARSCLVKGQDTRARTCDVPPVDR